MGSGRVSLLQGMLLWQHCCESCVVICVLSTAVSSFHKGRIVCVNRNCVGALGVWLFLVGYLSIFYSAMCLLSPKTDVWFEDQHGETTHFVFYKCVIFYDSFPTFFITNSCSQVVAMSLLHSYTPILISAQCL